MITNIDNFSIHANQIIDPPTSTFSDSIIESDLT